MQTPQLFSLFLAGANDVATEQDIVKSVVRDWNIEHAAARGVYINLTSWRDNAYPDIGPEPQAVINRQLLDSADIVVGIFWTRFGTSTSSAGSGTDEEIRRSIAAGKKVLVYFSDRPISPSHLDQEQYRKIQEFKQRYSNNLYCSVGTPEEFRDKFRRHLALAIGDLLQHPDRQQTDTSQAVIPMAFTPKAWLAIAFALNSMVRGAITRIEELRTANVAPESLKEEERLALTIPILTRARILHVLAEGGHVRPDPNDILSYDILMRGILQAIAKNET